MILLQKHQAKSASETLTRAFLDDPLLSYFIPKVSSREKLLRYVFEVRIKFAILHGEVYGTSPNLEGVAVWLPDNKADMTVGETIRHYGIKAFFKIGLGTMFRMLPAGSFICDTRKKFAPKHYWYLSSIGIAPEFQGKGYGGALLKPMFARFDKEGLSCYLEAQKKKNIDIYLHYGFKVVDEAVIPGTTVNHWAMIREPATT
ncbi:MAG: GNAT family N-acetyltransferase [Chloroflexi bacterium]|nr:GNAT family N-acetyltransferase [Chloroflexota bacterium]